MYSIIVVGTMKKSEKKNIEKEEITTHKMRHTREKKKNKKNRIIHINPEW